MKKRMILGRSIFGCFRVGLVGVKRLLKRFNIENIVEPSKKPLEGVKI
jgi:hypothetical protein